MRYVMFFVSLGMFMLVACPQRLPELRPQPPGPGGENSTVKTIRPSKFDRPSALNPGNIVIKLSSSSDIKDLGYDDKSGVQQYSIKVETDHINPWVVQAGAKEVLSDNIMLASFPNYSPIISVFKEADAGFMKVHRYSFQMEFEKEGQDQTMELYIVARNKSYCLNLVQQSRAGQVTAVNGIEPNVPEEDADCNTMNDGNIYNFDQKIRLQLLVKNVQSERGMVMEDAKRKFKQKIFCSVIKNTMNTVLKKVTAKWGSGNDLRELGADIMTDFAAGFFDFKMAIGGYDCSSYNSAQQGNGGK